jgi:hypothetical protein
MFDPLSFENATIGAAANGNLDILQWLGGDLEGGVYKCSTRVMDVAAENGQRPVVAYEPYGRIWTLVSRCRREQKRGTKSMGQEDATLVFSMSKNTLYALVIAVTRTPNISATSLMLRGTWLVLQDV